jgi:hypothetical protein
LHPASLFSPQFGHVPPPGDLDEEIRQQYTARLKNQKVEHEAMPKRDEKEPE